MINKKLLFVLSSALVIGLLTGCGLGDKANGNSGKVDTETSKEMAETFLSSIVVKQENSAIKVQYKVKNISGKTQKLTFPSGLQADYIIYDQSGKKIKQYSEEVASTQAIREVTLENNQQLEEEFTITGLQYGSYKIEVFLTAKEQQAKVVTDVLVEKSLSKGSGILVGQIDPHTIEINMDGNKQAFQLSDHAIQQYASLKEGEQISFVYNENENGQKVIQEFVVASKKD